MRLDVQGSQEYLGTVFGKIIFHINTLRHNIGNITPEQYADSGGLRDIIAMRLQAIGELIKLVSGKNTDQFGLMENFPDFPWENFKGMRDYIAHNYTHINISYPWEAYSELLPEFEKIIDVVCGKYEKVKQNAQDTLNRLNFEARTNLDEYMELHNVKPHSGKQRYKQAAPRRKMS